VTITITCSYKWACQVVTGKKGQINPHNSQIAPKSQTQDKYTPTSLNEAYSIKLLKTFGLAKE